MRIGQVIGAALLCIAPIASIAASPQASIPASRGEIALHLSASGQSIKRADYVTISVPVSTSRGTGITVPVY